MAEHSIDLVPNLIRGRKSNGRSMYHAEAKRELVRRCLQPGVSLAATAVAHGLNPNLLRRWVVLQTGQPRSATREPKLLAVTALPSLRPEAVRAPVPTAAPGQWQLELVVPGARSGSEDASKQLDYVPGYFQVIRHVRPKLARRACARIVQAAASARPIERALPSAGLLAQVIAAKYADPCPLYRQEGIYRRSGVELPRAMLASWIGETADLLDPLVGSLERYVLSAQKLHADETPVPVLAPGKGRTQTGRLWAYVRDDRPSSGPDPPVVAYRYSPDRKAERPHEHLRSFTAILQADAYSGFAPLYADGRIVEAACWAHARRKYYDVYLMDRSPTAHEALERIGELYAIEREIRGQLPKDRLAVRRARSAPLLEALQSWLRATHAVLSVKSPLAGAIQYTLARWAALTRYTDDGRIEIDNNAAERAIRALVLGRRNYLFAGSDAGGETAARPYSLIGTCRLNDIDPHLYLRYVLERIAEHPIKPHRRAAAMASRRSAAQRAVPGGLKDLLAADLQLRIELLHIEPHVWRRVIVPETVTLAKLHQILQAVMGWTDSHLHEYVIARQRYGTPDPDWPSTEPVLDERRVQLKPFIEARVRRFIYLYDFRDHWEHQITVEDLVAANDARRRVVCTAGENACPPEDVGREPGYATFLEAIADPHHEQHEELQSWVGYPFDPHAFDLNAANQRLARINP